MAEAASDNSQPSKDPQFRRARARLAGLALHAKNPGLAAWAGRKGGEVTASSFASGKQAWGVAMAMRRWHGTPYSARSRAPWGRT